MQTKIQCLQKKLLKSFYVDDLVTGSNSVEKALILYEKAMKRMKEGGILMRKWKSNKNELIKRIEKDQAQYIRNETSESSKRKFEDNEVKTENLVPDKELSDGKKVLGVNWDILKGHF